MAAFTVNTAPVKWAQRVDSLYVTISLPDVADAKVDIKDKTLEFTGTSMGKQYQLSLEFVSYFLLCYYFCTELCTPCTVQGNRCRRVEVERPPSFYSNEAEQEEQGRGLLAPFVSRQGMLLNE
jgi:hypothetical protein